MDAFFAAVFTAVLGVIFAPPLSDLWADIKPALGAPLTDLIRILAYIVVAAFSFAVLHYFGILGAGAELQGTRERGDYEELRARIASGNWIAREYAFRLYFFLNSVDRFLGDAGMADRTLFPQAFGLRRPAPLWTAPSFDRCLLLALVYPVAAIVLIWVVSNDVGPAEAALGLYATDDWRRAIVFGALGLLGFAFWRYMINTGLRSLAWLAVASISALGSAVVVDAVSEGVDFGLVISSGAVFIVAVCAATGVVAFAVSGGTGTGAGAGAIAFAVGGTLAIGAGFAVGGVGPVGYGAVVVAFALAAAFSLATMSAFDRAGPADGDEKRPGKLGWQGVFLGTLVAFMILMSFAGATLLSHLDNWRELGSPLLFLGLLTLINAPFDWLSLGLTRALMRRGLEREKWWPYLYALIDALLASAVIAVLAMAMVAGVQLFDDLAVYGGGERVLPPMRKFLEAIKADPGKPEYWWVYATLFSTMLPSLINLFIAGVSLARGVPGISSWLMGKVREGEAVPAYDRLLVAIVLALQGVAGLTIAIVAQGFLFWVIIWQGMPRLGIGVLDLAYLVAH